MVELRKLNDYFPNAVVINLDRRTDRLEQFNKQAVSLDISYQRLPAVEAENPVAGCKASHLLALDADFVFEDDAVFVDDFHNLFAKAMDSLPDDWDMIYLGAHIVDTQRINDYWLRSTVCSSTHAYAIRPEVKRHFKETAEAYDGHIDVAYAKLHKKFKAYIARPSLVYQGASYSDIRGEEVDYKSLYFR